MNENTTSNQEPITGLLDVIHMNEIQHPTKSLLQDYWMSYIQMKYNIQPRAYYRIIGCHI